MATILQCQDILQIGQSIISNEADSKLTTIIQVLLKGMDIRCSTLVY